MLITPTINFICQLVFTITTERRVRLKLDQSFIEEEKDKKKKNNTTFIQFALVSKWISFRYF